MKGSVRRRPGGSYEINVTTGKQERQRCEACGHRAWVERRPQKACPRCGAELQLTVERRREIKGGYRTQREAQAAVAKIITAVHEQSYAVPSKATVKELAGEWLAAIRPTIRETTHASYAQHMHFHVLPFIGQTQALKVTGASLNRLYATLLESGRKNGKKGLSPSTVNHVHACLHRFFRDAMKWGWLPRNPADSADPPHQRGTERREMKTWTAEQLRAFLDFTKEDDLYPLWHTLAMTGMRRGEGLGLRWEDVDFEAARLSVRRALIPSGREVVVSEPKTARGRRSIAIDPETVAVLKTQAARQLEQQAAWQEGWTDSGYVFTAEDGRYLNPEAVTRWFRQAVKKSMLPKIRLHDLRHTHATLALQAGVHPKVVSERLGHATVSITLDTYSHAIPAMQEEAAALIAGLVFSA
jgi:integrase/predicted RNA-binding Zn-ribbon protein involved in translation (DUF1610 family)